MIGINTFHGILGQGGNVSPPSSGYGYLSYLYIEEFLWDAWACKDLSVTNEMLKGVRTLI